MPHKMTPRERRALLAEAESEYRRDIYPLDRDDQDGWDKAGARWDNAVAAINRGENPYVRPPA